MSKVGGRTVPVQCLRVLYNVIAGPRRCEALFFPDLNRAVGLLGTIRGTTYSHNVGLVEAHNREVALV